MKDGVESKKIRGTLLNKHLPQDNRKDMELTLHRRKGIQLIVWDVDIKGWRNIYGTKSPLPKL